MGMKVRLLAERTRGCQDRKEMARKLLELKKIHGGRLSLFSKTATPPGRSIDPKGLDTLGSYLHVVRKNKAVLGRVEQGTQCYEARLARFEIKPSDPSITLEFVISIRMIPCAQSSIKNHFLDHGRAAMERATNYLQELVARNVGSIYWMRLPETDGSPLPVQTKKSCFTPIVLPDAFSRSFSVLVPILTGVALMNR